MKSVYKTARINKDKNFDGKFIFGVKTTRIYCRPSCPAPVAKEKNVVYFHDMFEALDQFYRPCMRCRTDINIDYYNGNASGTLTVQTAMCATHRARNRFHCGRVCPQPGTFPGGQGGGCCKIRCRKTLCRHGKHMQETSSKNVYRFRDKTLNIVADPKTHRVLVMFEQFDKIDQSGVQNLIGDLFMVYGEPTISAHDKVVYWAWAREKKVTAEQYKTAKEKKKRLDIIATVKLNSEIKIMEKSEGKEMGDAYYIISSDPLLQFFKED